MTLDEVIDQQVQAIGGHLAVEAIKTIRIEIHVIEPDFEIDGVYAADRSGKMRVDIFMEGKRVFSEGYTDGQGWQLPQDASSGIPTSPAGTNALAHGIEQHLFGLHELQARGHKLELAETEIVDGTEFAVLNQVYPDGGVIWKLINLANGLIERSREHKALHPDIDPTETTIETRFSNFRNVDGLMRSFHEIQVDLNTGKTLSTLDVNKVEINPGLDTDYFERP